jgi:hypothetical protein
MTPRIRKLGSIAKFAWVGRCVGQTGEGGVIVERERKKKIVCHLVRFIYPALKVWNAGMQECKNAAKLRVYAAARQ